MSTLSTELVSLGKGVMRCTYPYRERRMKDSIYGYIMSFLQKCMIPTIMDFTYIWDRRISRLMAEDSYRLTYIHCLVVGIGIVVKREKGWGVREKVRGGVTKNVCVC